MRLREGSFGGRSVKGSMLLRRHFDVSYVAPGRYDNWKTDRHMVDCVNHRMRVRGLVGKVLLLRDNCRID